MSEAPRERLNITVSALSRALWAVAQTSMPQISRRLSKYPYRICLAAVSTEIFLSLAAAGTSNIPMNSGTPIERQSRSQKA